MLGSFTTIRARTVLVKYSHETTVTMFLFPSSDVIHFLWEHPSLPQISSQIILQFLQEQLLCVLWKSPLGVVKASDISSSSLRIPILSWDPDVVALRQWCVASRGALQRLCCLCGVRETPSPARLPPPMTPVWSLTEHLLQELGKFLTYPRPSCRVHAF